MGSMTEIKKIDHESLEFPDTSEALAYPNGLLAVGGDLSIPRLLRAYQQGIFPWYKDPQPIMWWSPDPRSVMFPDELRISRSLRKSMRQSDFRITADRAFHRVVAGCAAPRDMSSDTWITHAMGRAYIELFRFGHAHSVEVWSRNNRLIGGLYGVTMGQVFCGESMFSKQTNASKMALVATTQILAQSNYNIIDCQVENDHLASLGARSIPRLDFERYLPHTVDTATPSEGWVYDKLAQDVL